MGGVVEKVLPRCSQIPLPSAGVHHIQRRSDAMDIHVLQGARIAEDCRSLARFQLTGIPPSRRQRGFVCLSIRRKWTVVRLSNRT